MNATKARNHESTRCAVYFVFSWQIALGARPSNDHNGLLVGALRARAFRIIGVLAGGAGLLGACCDDSDTLLEF